MWEASVTLERVQLCAHAYALAIRLLWVQALLLWVIF